MSHGTQPPNDPYEDLKVKKRKRKEIEKKVPDNWALGEKVIQYENSMSDGAPKKKSNSATTKRKKKTISNEFKDEFLKDEKKTRSLPLQSDESDFLRVKPLSDWLSVYGSPNGKSVQDLRLEVQSSMSSTIAVKKNDSNVKKNVAQKKKPRAITEETKREMKLFFESDQTSESFEMKSASDYQIFRDMKIEIEKKKKRSDGPDPCNWEIPEVRCCSPAYCQDFLREAKSNAERHCRRRKKCIFMLLATRYPDSIEDTKTEDGFVCREFLLPDQLEAYKIDPTALPNEEQLCLGCNRLMTTFWYYNYLSKNEEPAELLQDHYNPIGQEGGYPSEYFIYPNPTESKFTGISRPIIKFSKNTYVYAKIKFVNDISGKELTLKCVKETIVGEF